MAELDLFLTKVYCMGQDAKLWLNFMTDEELDTFMQKENLRMKDHLHGAVIGYD